MTKVSLTALMIWALCLAAATCGSAKVQGPQTSEKRTDEPSTGVLTLTQDRPTNSVPCKGLVISYGDDQVLVVTITEVKNPSLTPIAIDVYLSYQKVGESETRRELVGNFSLYPADQPGKFALNAKPALGKVRLAIGASKLEQVRLVFEMKRIDETRAWTPVELTIAQPTWRAAEN